MSTAMKNAYMAQVAATDTILYTCPVNTTARVIKCTITNDTTTVSTISFNKVPSGESVDVTNLILNERAIGSKETYVSHEVEGQVLDSRDIISAIAGSADQLTVALDVVEIV